MAKDQSVIYAQNLHKKFADFSALKDVCLNVKQGEIYGFLGPNGCGKSTLIRCLTGLLAPTQGQVEVLGHHVPNQADALRLKIGYMTQKFSLYESLSVSENLDFIGQIFGLRGKALLSRKQAQMQLYSLESMATQIVSGMSGGQKQRLALACATMHRPELLFLDEPTSAVDPENRRDFWEKLFDLSEQGTTILVTTHYMDEAERCHRLAIMQSGEIRANDSPEALMAQMKVNIVEIQAINLRDLKQRLLQTQVVYSAAQLGIRLRVLIDQKIADPIAWLKAHEPSLHSAKLEIVRPTLEDVFVSVTGEK